MTIHPKILVLPFLCWLLGSSLSTQAAVIECNQCAADAYAQKARAAGVGDQFVYDLASAALHQFKVDCPGTEFDRASPEPARATADALALRRAELERAQAITAACKQPLLVTTLQPASYAQSAFTSALSFYRLAGNARTLVVKLAMRDFPQVREGIRESSALDHVADNNLRAMTANWLLDSHHPVFAEPVKLALDGLTEDMLGSVFNSGLHVQFELAFVDGSQAQYDWDLHAQKVALVPGSAVFDGNVLPLPYAPSAAGSYRFSTPENAARFAHWMAQWGAATLVGDPRPGTAREVLCVRDAQGMHCELTSLAAPARDR